MDESKEDSDNPNLNTNNSIQIQEKKPNVLVHWQNYVNNAPPVKPIIEENDG